MDRDPFRRRAGAAFQQSPQMFVELLLELGGRCKAVRGGGEPFSAALGPEPAADEVLDEIELRQALIERLAVAKAADRLRRLAVEQQIRGAAGCACAGEGVLELPLGPGNRPLR